MDANHITYQPNRRLTALCGVLMSCLAAATLSACAAAATKIGDLAAAPLEYVGLIQSSADEGQTAADTAKENAQFAKDKKEAVRRAAIRKVNVSFAAGPNLNANSSGQGLSLVVRVYTLRSSVAFAQAPYETFTNPEREAEAFGEDVVKSREVVLTPGQQVLSPQDIGPEVNAVAIVALFRSPAANRWRVVFNLKEAARDGIVVGANACALSVTSGVSGNDADGRPWPLLPARCPP